MNRFSALDGLRGLACIIVVIYHYILSFFPSIIFNSNSQRHYNIESYLSDFPFIAFYNGHLSVIIFFVLSSFILIVVILNNNVIYNGLSNKFFLKMGSLSFSIYLLHFIILCSYSSWLFNLLFLLTESYMLSFFISFITSLILIYYMALLFYKFIDNKAIILSQLSYIKLSKWSKLS